MSGEVLEYNADGLIAGVVRAGIGHVRSAALVMTGVAAESDAERAELHVFDVACRAADEAARKLYGLVATRVER